MRSFCSKSSEQCPEKHKSCSRLLALNNEGEICRLWLANQPESIQDEIKIQYCIGSPNAPDCDCINRANHPEFLFSKQSHNFNAGCWFVPCLKPGVLKTSDINTKNCPTNVCQIINNISAGNNIFLRNNKNLIHCGTDNQPKPSFPKVTLQFEDGIVIFCIFLVIYKIFF